MKYFRAHYYLILAVFLVSAVLLFSGIPSLKFAKNVAPENSHEDVLIDLSLEDSIEIPFEYSKKAKKKLVFFVYAPDSNTADLINLTKEAALAKYFYLHNPKFAGRYDVDGENVAIYKIQKYPKKSKLIKEYKVKFPITEKFKYLAVKNSGELVAANIKDKLVAGEDVKLAKQKDLGSFKIIDTSVANPLVAARNFSLPITVKYIGSKLKITKTTSDTDYSELLLAIGQIAKKTVKWQSKIAILLKAPEGLGPSKIKDTVLPEEETFLLGDIPAPEEGPKEIPAPDEPEEIPNKDPAPRQTLATPSATPSPSATPPPMCPYTNNKCQALILDYEPFVETYTTWVNSAAAEVETVEVPKYEFSLEEKRDEHNFLYDGDQSDDRFAQKLDELCELQIVRIARNTYKKPKIRTVFGRKANMSSGQYDRQRRSYENQKKLFINNFKEARKKALQAIHDKNPELAIVIVNAHGSEAILNSGFLGLRKIAKSIPSHVFKQYGGVYASGVYDRFFETRALVHHEINDYLKNNDTEKPSTCRNLIIDGSCYGGITPKVFLPYLNNLSEAKLSDFPKKDKPTYKIDCSNNKSHYGTIGISAASDFNSTNRTAVEELYKMLLPKMDLFVHDKKTVRNIFDEAKIKTKLYEANLFSDNNNKEDTAQFYYDDGILNCNK